MLFCYCCILYARLETNREAQLCHVFPAKVHCLLPPNPKAFQEVKPPAMPAEANLCLCHGFFSYFGHHGGQLPGIVGHHARPLMGIIAFHLVLFDLVWF